MCTAATSLDVLDYVNRTPASIGYVEADAVPYFTNLKVIKVDGYPPTRDTVLNQRYRFVASEYLYTAGQPARADGRVHQLPDERPDVGTAAGPRLHRLLGPRRVEPRRRVHLARRP